MFKSDIKRHGTVCYIHHHRHLIRIRTHRINGRDRQCLGIQYFNRKILCKTTFIDILNQNLIIVVGIEHIRSRFPE